MRGLEAATAPHLREERISGEMIAHGRFLQVRRDTVRMPDGATASREYVVHPGAVVIVPLLEDSGRLHVVLERQFRYPVGQVMVEFPAGKLDAGERQFQCAQRELQEETGYTASEWAYVGIMHPVIAYSTEFIGIWFARGLAAGPRALDAGEFLDVFTTTAQQFFMDCQQGLVTDAKTLTCALHLQNFMSGAWPLQWHPASYWAEASAAGPKAP